MKKLLFSTLMILTAVCTQAQVSAQLGIKGGINVSKLSKDADVTYDSRTGFHAGAYAMLKFANIGIQPELLYSQQGTEVSFDQAANDFEQDYTYMSIPVLLKFYLAGGLNVHAGPQFGLLLGADGTTLDENNQPTSLDKDELKNSDVSGILGIGWDTPLGFNLSARYLLGFSDISENDFDTKSRIFQLSVGFRLLDTGR